MLSREKVIAEGLALMDREGLKAVSMRRLADRLGVTPMALYNHVGSKQDLLGGIAEHVAGRTDFFCDDPDWRERIRSCFRRLRKACLAHPGSVELMERLDAPPLAVFRPLEITLAALEEAGADPKDGLKAYFALMNFTLGQISYEVRGPFQGLDPSNAAGNGRLEGYTHIEAAMSSEPWDFDGAFEFGLSTILSGVEQLAGRAKPPGKA
jgi:AcrR family transcriptional regulator